MSSSRARERPRFCRIRNVPGDPCRYGHPLSRPLSRNFFRHRLFGGDYASHSQTTQGSLVPRGAGRGAWLFLFRVRGWRSKGQAKNRNQPRRSRDPASATRDRPGAEKNIRTLGPRQDNRQDNRRDNHGPSHDAQGKRKDHRRRDWRPGDCRLDGDPRHRHSRRALSAARMFSFGSLAFRFRSPPRSANFGIERLSQIIVLVWLWFRSAHDRLAAEMMRTSKPPH